MKLTRTYTDKPLDNERTLAVYVETGLLSFVYKGMARDFDPTAIISEPSSSFSKYSSIPVSEYMDMYCKYPLTKKDNETITNLST